ncbi:transporter substrate-binding domain-containing protein [Muribaculum sp.]|jgi:ABC-type amino acid transport substrate-binding protein|uniref:transporter substrate-binding domain-containing protein n=2 Tax=Muribaculum TaxID=1918540 RepID=UPI00257C97E2|nr:transporter substrate-binding domain-containing protein [Muribaculum sp.]
MKQLKFLYIRSVIYVVALAVAVISMVSLRKCQHSHAGSDTGFAETDTLDVAIEYSPLSFYTYADTLGGFNYDLLNYIAGRHGLTLRFHPVVSLSQSLENLDKGSYDILVADIPLTYQYREKLNFLEPVMTDRQVLVQLRDSVTKKPPVKRQLDLAGDTVWVIAGSSVADRISNLSQEIGDTIYVRPDSVNGAEQLFILTAMGQIKHAVINERVARQLIKDYPQADISVYISFSQFQSWIAGGRHPWVADSLNSWIKQAKNDKAYKTLTKRYLK